jgi:dolichol-phosphate mannosyltransferase
MEFKILNLVGFICVLKLAGGSLNYRGVYLRKESKGQNPLVSVVIPAYDEARGIKATIEKVEAILEKAFDSYEIIVVDDGSEDETYEQAEQTAGIDSRIKLIKFTRNFGKESAMVAGLRLSRGGAVVVIDSDLQHPPELIPEMYQIWKEKGVKVVNGVKRARQQENFVKRGAVNLFYGMMKLLTGFDLKNHTDFKLLDRDVVAEYIQLPESLRFFRGLIPWLGFSSENVYFTPDLRTTGRTGWSLLGLSKMGIMAICSFSSLPMHAVTLLGFFMFFASFLMSIHTFVMKITGQAEEGFATVILLLLFVGSLIMMSLGIIGQYISMIYHEVKKRPGYIIEKSRCVDETKE